MAPRNVGRARRVLRIGVFGLFPVALLAGGCGHTVTATTRRALDTLPAETTMRAYVYRDNLILQFLEGGRQTFFKAAWKGRGLEKAGKNRFRTAQLTLVEERPKGIETMRSSVREATIASAEKFRAVLLEVGERLAPSRAGEGTFIVLGDREFVIYREAAGRAPLVSAAKAPQGVRIVRRVNPTELASEILAVIEDSLREARDPRRLFLVVSERAGAPPAYGVFDLDQKVVLIATWPGTADVAAEQSASGKSWRMLQAVVIEGQLVALVKNPISFVGRAVNFALQTAGVILRRRAWPTPEIQPVAADRPGMDLPAFEAKLDSMLGSHRSRGSIRLLLDGPGFFPLFERRIEEAKESLHLRVCIWDTDDVAVGLADRVRRRSMEISDTRVLVDRASSLGSGEAPPGTRMPEGFEPPRSIQTYLKSGSRVRVRNFLNAMTMGDHSKVLIVDRKYAFLGGMNLGREYRYEWHDAMVELEGPIVARFQRDFELAWSHASALGDLAYAGTALTPSKIHAGLAEGKDYVDVRPIYTKTLSPGILRALREALRRAQKYAWIENPYIFDDTVVRDLIAARRRGVDVRVVMPSEADMASAESTNKAKANRLIENGIRLYAYPGMLHTKTIIVDGWVLFGSCNFNKLSLRTNYEADIATSDPTFAGQIKRDLFEADFARSEELTDPVPVTGGDRLAELLAHHT